MPENRKMEHAPDGPPTIERANLPHMTAEGRPDALPSDAKSMAADVGKPRPGQPIAVGIHAITPGLHGIDASHVASDRDLMSGAAGPFAPGSPAGGPLAHAPEAS